ncbi:MAG: hypothetical protein K5795_01160 [Lachnospiraceae bacterium]|nr:hypothetical protein [Lachnospiraceae bacterium]
MKKNAEIRRCGKSYLLFNLFRDQLESDGVSDDHIIEMAFGLSKKARMIIEVISSFRNANVYL